MRTSTSLPILLTLPSLTLCAGLWLSTTPQSSFPYALKKGAGTQLGSGETWNTFPVTGNSSAHAFTIMNTNGPKTPDNETVFPHVHRKTFENFYAAKGRVQLWGQGYNGWVSNTTEQTTRVLTQGDFGGIPNGTVHKFQMLEPDTQLTGVLVPGGFEEFFFAQADGFLNDPNTGFNFSALPEWDVYPYLNYTPRTDVVNNKAGPGNWYDGSNVYAEEVATGPIWVANNYGGKWLNREDGRYQIVAPLVTGAQSGGLFAQGHITISLQRNFTAPWATSTHATAFVVEEGQLAVTVDGYEKASLIGGDIVFIPPETKFTYEAEAEFTKVMYVSGGGEGLDAMLISRAESWTSAFYPRDQGSIFKRGVKI
ncbi:RmlC-like cupin domain-containing protein [Lophiotrema nucula]|uniref:RmlC-like cupin domain-containing protein n=1 Tax=Lophiotrema nucula TaxID=690887 RepID=A0A6A5ZIT2_9PLEO|nr:RmlC-like cupin domain-containing protein [Lophiotrema nucula]